MQSKAEYWRKLRRFNADSLGLAPRRDRALAAQVAVDGAEAEIWNLPVAVADSESIQTSTGVLRFITGLSDPGGTDVL